MTSEDPYDLGRFVAAQDEDGTYDSALAELCSGRKMTHWMWFVFPQVAGLGSSQLSRHFAISSLEEAKAYLAHPVLGRRLGECAGALLAVEARSAEQLLGATDALKLRASMTLFSRAAPDAALFDEVPDPATEARI
jgi:uncharacterized protein (DUF1810 family)